MRWYKHAYRCKLQTRGMPVTVTSLMQDVSTYKSVEEYYELIITTRGWKGANNARINFFFNYCTHPTSSGFLFLFSFKVSRLINLGEIAPTKGNLFRSEKCEFLECNKFRKRWLDKRRRAIGRAIEHLSPKRA